MLVNNAGLKLFGVQKRRIDVGQISKVIRKFGGFVNEVYTGWGLCSGTANRGYSEAVFEAMTTNFCHY